MSIWHKKGSYTIVFTAAFSVYHAMPTIMAIIHPMIPQLPTRIMKIHIFASNLNIPNSSSDNLHIHQPIPSPISIVIISPITPQCIKSSYAGNINMPAIAKIIINTIKSSSRYTSTVKKINLVHLYYTIFFHFMSIKRIFRTNEKALKRGLFVTWQISSQK